MNDEHPPGRVPLPRQHRVNTRPMIWGAVLGFIASWLLIALTLIGLYSTYGDSTSTRQNVVAVAIPALPAIIAVALLVAPRTRYLGAGLLAGFAIGYILGAGVCVGATRSPWTDSSPVGDSLPGSYPGTARHGPF